MGTPHWSKLPDLIEDLLARAPEYGLFPAMRLADALWSDGADGTDRARGVRVEPHPALSFPAADLRHARIDEEGCLRLAANVHGLYGIDGPLPHYLLEAAARDDEVGARFRAFMDIFNARLYELAYEAWSLADGVGAGAYAAQARALLGGGEGDNHGAPLGRGRQSPAALAAATRALVEAPVRVEDGIVQWVAVPDRSGLGRGRPPCLGDDALLGDSMQVAGERVDVVIGPIARDEAMTLVPGNEPGDRLVGFLRSLLGPSTPFDLVLRVEGAEGEGAGTLGGAGLPLGWATWLGDRVDDEVTVRITAGREATGAMH